MVETGHMLDGVESVSAGPNEVRLPDMAVWNATTREQLATSISNADRFGTSERTFTAG